MKVALRILFLITLCMPVLLYGQGASGEKATKIKKIVIDPGHGGKDPGCVYKNHLEKDINLSIALKFGDLVKKNFPDVDVVYTRSTDKYIGLAERSSIANKAGADLFISVHINANESTAVNGTSTYIMGVDNTAANLAVAMKENDVIVYEDDYTTKYEGFTPGDPTSYIIFSLMQSANRDQSMKFAEIVQKHYSHDLPMKDIGARQASLIVLWKASMPAILTEVGFMSNQRDREYITTNKGQSEAARSLFNAFSEYKSKSEGSSSMVMLKEKTSLPDIKEQLTAQERAAVEAAAQQTSAPAQRPAATQQQAQQRPATAQQPASSGQAKPAAQQSVSQQQRPAAQQQTLKHNIRFYVQVASLSRPKDRNSADFLSYRGKVVEKRAANGTYKYLVGGYSSYDEGMRQLSVVRREFRDAFLVAFEGDTQLNLEDARARAR